MAAIDPTEVGGYATASMASSGSNPTNMVNAAGAIVSLALIVGVGVWGYKLLVRDVTGIPVVEAIDGPMREAPTDPGGTIANHIGLSVNEVAAEGVAAAAQDTVLLAPAKLTLMPVIWSPQSSIRIRWLETPKPQPRQPSLPPSSKAQLQLRSKKSSCRAHL